jgi:hypothetical protein
MQGLPLALVAAAAGIFGGPKIVLSRPLPATVRAGQTVAVRGRLERAAVGARAALQTRHGGPWATVAKRRPRIRGRFVIRWSVPISERTGPLMLRVAELERGRVVSATPARASAVAPAPVLCAPPVPPAVNVAAGSGWIVGGLYLEGGAYPGTEACEQQPYTIDVETSSGTIVASQAVAGGHSYTLVVPAGSYTLRANGCTGSATVTAGRQTTANTYCLLP